MLGSDVSCPAGVVLLFCICIAWAFCPDMDTGFKEGGIRGYGWDARSHELPVSNEMWCVRPQCFARKEHEEVIHQFRTSTRLTAGVSR